MTSAARSLNQNPIHFETGEIETFSRRHGQELNQQLRYPYGSGYLRFFRDEMALEKSVEEMKEAESCLGLPLITTQRYLGKFTDTEAMRWIENLYA